MLKETSKDLSNKQKVTPSTRSGNPSVMYYGLAFAQMAGLKYNDALISINKIDDASVKNHPAYFSLKAQILMALNKYNDSNKVYLQALESYPNYKGLWLGQVDLYIKSKDMKRVAVQLDDLSQLYPNDGDIWARTALVYSDVNLNDKPKYHYALGNQLFLRMNYKAALDQYQLALKNVNNKIDNEGVNSIKNTSDSVLNNEISSKIIDTQNIIKYQIQYGG
jgi:predicted Zn-dependent protease